MFLFSELDQLGFLQWLSFFIIICGSWKAERVIRPFEAVPRIDPVNMSLCTPSLVEFCTCIAWNAGVKVDYIFGILIGWNGRIIVIFMYLDWMVNCHSYNSIALCPHVEKVFTVQ